MRLYYLLALLAYQFLITNPTSAQGFKGGLIIGINGSNITGGPGDGLRQLGFVSGGFVQFDFHKKYGFKTEMIFNQKGARKPPNPDLGNYFLYTARLNYIDAPMLFTYNQDNFIYEFGPSVGFLLSEKEELQSSFIQIRPFRPLDFALNLGINYRLAENFDMNWRLSHSFIPVRQHLGGSTFRLNRGEYNFVLSFRLIYWIRKIGQNGGK